MTSLHLKVIKELLTKNEKKDEKVYLTISRDY